MTEIKTIDLDEFARRQKEVLYDQRRAIIEAISNTMEQILRYSMMLHSDEAQAICRADIDTLVGILHREAELTRLFTDKKGGKK